MKKILISIRPQWVAKILNGEKTLEIRKTAPKDLPCEVYIYCTKNEYLYRTNKGCFSSKKPLRVGKGTEYTFAYSDEGMVVAKFTMRKVDHFIEGLNDFERETIPPYERDEYDYPILDETLHRACLTDEDIEGYAPNNTFYAWHIRNLEILSKPKYLYDFWTLKKTGLYSPIIKAPQSWCYVVEAVS